MAQTRMYAQRADVLAPQLRAEIATVPDRPHGRALLIVLMGLPGVGKSHCARLLCARLGAAHVASDELRSRLFIAPSYADEENRAVFAAAGALVDSLLADGHRVILDATNLVARNREAAVAMARRHAVPVAYVRVTASDEDTLRRLAARRTGHAADDHSEADERVYERMRAQAFEPPAAGFVELRNGADVSNEVERIAGTIEAATR
jgi:predicted kinase